MTQPISHASRTVRYDLPLLFAGQAQKEFTVNDALTRVSTLLHPAVEGESAAPPDDPVDGECWQVASPASDAWAGQEGAIACRTDAAWVFIQPSIGLRCYDKAAGTTLLFDGTWQRPEALAPASGGTTQDTEARAAIASLIASLEQSGLI